MANAAAQTASLIQALGGGLSTLYGTKQKQTGGSFKQTEKTDISEEGINSLLQGLLQSTQGLAAVSGGQRAAGLYNSATNQMLVNDLIARAAGQVAERAAPKTTTRQASPTVTSQEGQGGNAMQLIAALTAAKKAKDFISPLLAGGVSGAAAADMSGGGITSMLDSAGITGGMSYAGGSPSGFMGDAGFLSQALSGVGNTSDAFFNLFADVDTSAVSDAASSVASDAGDWISEAWDTVSSWF